MQRELYTDEQKSTLAIIKLHLMEKQPPHQGDKGWLLAEQVKILPQSAFYSSLRTAIGMNNSILSRFLPHIVSGSFSLPLPPLTCLLDI